MITNKHIPVFAKELIDSLDIKENAVYVDCTVGRGGHASLLLKKIPLNSRLIAFDQDQTAIDYCEEKFKNISNVKIIKSNFKDIEKHITCKVDGIIMDIGVSSPQLDDATRGFSYRKDGVLDMRMNNENALTAKIVINTYSLEKLIKIFKEYGEEKYSVSIAKKIISVREEKEINTTLELVDIIKSSTPSKYKKLKHPAKKVFQALRIEVNKELDVLVEATEKATKLLKPKGVLSIITFHSLEDRIVKNYFKKLVTPTKTPKHIPIIDVDDTEFYLPHKKPLKPTPQEIYKNKRATSAKLRTIRKRG